MNTTLSYLQIGIAILLIVFILLQQRGQALGSAFGGDSGSFYSTRRGIQKKIFWATIVAGFLFVVISLLNLVL